MQKLFFLIAFLGALSSLAQPTISFTFDDGITRDRSGYKFKEWNQMILDALAEEDLTSVFFVTGFDKSDEKGRYLLQSWDDAGHTIANHTFSHPNFNSELVELDQFKEELLGTDTIINAYVNYSKLFRFPYLKEGEDTAEIEEVRAHLKREGYRNGHVTVDASDWYIDSRLRKRLSEDPSADVSLFKAYYLEHMLDRATFYEGLAYEMTGRHISHTLLLHHNLSSALFLGDLIDMFKSRGWKVISAQDAYEDAIFDQVPVHAGESLIWAMAKDARRYEDVLRYPAEDSRYEEAAMDERGL